MRCGGLVRLRQLCAPRSEGLAAQKGHQSQAASTAAQPLQQQIEPVIGPEEREKSLELVRRHNSSLQQLRGHTIGATIFRTDKRYVFLDSGYNKPVKFARKSLQLSQLVSSRDGGVRTSPEDFRVGDVLKFVVEEIETPYGDMRLTAEREVGAERFQRVWDLIKEAMRSNQVVMGRVLNAVPGGYCVGVAGLVAFCPFTSISGPTARRIGVLQPFLVLRMESARQNIVLVDYNRRPPPAWSQAGRFQGNTCNVLCALS